VADKKTDKKIILDRAESLSHPMERAILIQDGSSFRESGPAPLMIYARLAVPRRRR